uniref:GIPC1-3 GH1 domain-containing protein n=2 Tax=Wuchereria bancrofti TaxID=6293 RepID=A0A1I8ELS5_WUCBA
MEVSGRVASQNLLSNLNRSTSANFDNRNDNFGKVGQISGRGYEGSSEDTQRNPVNVSYDRRRSRSWQRRTQQLERSGPQQNLPPVYRGKRWRRRLIQKQDCLNSTTNAPPTTLANTSTNSNLSINVNLPHQQQQWNSKPISTSKLTDQKLQQKQHDRNTDGPFNEIKSNSIVKTCITNADIKLTFQVQLAHGSPTGIISGFNSIVQLYQAIANCYDEISVDDILFCTINTHRISMDALLCSTININDFIFAHIAGQKKEVTLVKTEKRNPVNVSYDRRRSRSWQRRTQQLERSGPQQNLPPVYRGKRWRRRLIQKQDCLNSTTNAPPTTLANTSTNSNLSINVNLPHQQQQWNSKPISTSKLTDQKLQQKQHDRNTDGPFNEIKSNSIVKTCITNADIKLTFQVQLAHGSPTGIISGFNSIVQLYQAIANCYDEISVDDILFCTINTHRISMDALLCSTININDFIFAHIAGQKKEVTLVKTEKYDLQYIFKCHHS